MPTVEEIYTECNQYFETVLVFSFLHKKFFDVHNIAIEKEGLLYLPFFHPSYVIRGSYPRETYKQEFKTIKRFLTY